MRTAIHYCVNCGAQYVFQWSGSYNAIGIPKEYQDKDYCPECKKAIIEALAPIEKKTEIKWLPTTEVTLKELLDHEKAVREERIAAQHDQTGFALPLMERVFAHLTNFETGEHSRDAIVKYQNREYSYHYWDSHPEDAKINVKARVHFGSTDIVAYY
jgi:hypothetical protein